ncbi:hypothetical protein PF007_g13352 [Phytophthora fragariae]|uniref:Protein kinase domain-containing protein n=1 Tax=Phytophthora fragariae TaxID=53985 RepID=A0A6A3EMH7_9STRA|nr:hypothetical protein PF009_g16368 [Phytophthora fragariae]KAE9106575.1 hypothetical protein PF007_g13352 [Phytophthora fragariae]
MEDEHGQTAVMESTENRAIDVVRNLVEDCSANVNSTAVRMAADCGYIDIQRILTPFLLAVASETTKDGEDFVLSPGIPSRCFIPPSEIELTLFHENGSIGGDFLAKWLDSDVAVKLFIPDAFSTSFEDEVRLWQQLRHPNVLKMYARWQHQRNEQIKQFISGVSDTFLLLNALKTVEERSAFLKILTKEMETVGKYRPDQLEVMKKTYRDIASKLEGNDWSELAPALFIPWYELVVGKWSKLGEGSFGSVHRAKWLDSDVVVKRVILAGSTGTANVSTTYSSFSASEDPSATQVQDDTAKRADACAMFRREVDIWFGFSHPHVVRLFGACHIGRPFFVCEYATNGTLVSYLRKSPDELWSKLHEAALGVQYLHARGVIHGDLKGNNIVVGSNVKAKVTDFGLSSVGDSEENTLVSGAWKWVAPELLDTNQVPTLASDVSLRSGSRPRRSSMSWRS